MIEQAYLTRIADVVQTDIAKVVLNGVYEITTFEQKAVTDSTVALNYIIPASAVSLVTTIEIKRADNSRISYKPVNLPVTSDTLMLETFEIEEVTS
ncbi:ketopantoate hydroxymethyltransferase [Paenibacillus polysaccharolyticus]|uniref:ketopantoate hydroxymethyltransferase n=1 Tax=Paenibacillus polysaccharolyticus TaxID=582692 RepID=UPI002040C7D0|nr:ketopantoate hydroxymethyltransferase [Paenibacillus polysaccharolyticus]MCM3131912.1 ketopantoate hydroxymethyltransferase [Paenibacillus polysaccharolyticus]